MCSWTTTREAGGSAETRGPHQGQPPPASSGPQLALPAPRSPRRDRKCPPSRAGGRGVLGAHWPRRPSVARRAGPRAGCGISGPHAGEGPPGLPTSPRPKATQQVPGPRRPGRSGTLPGHRLPFHPAVSPLPRPAPNSGCCGFGSEASCGPDLPGRAGDPTRALSRAPAFAHSCSPQSRVQPEPLRSTARSASRRFPGLARGSQTRRLF